MTLWHIPIKEFANRKKTYCASMIDLRVRGLANALIWKSSHGSLGSAWKSAESGGLRIERSVRYLLK
jgi:hypothetical protein